MKEILMVSEKNLSSLLQSNLKINCICDKKVSNLMKVIRYNMGELLMQLGEVEHKNFSLGLSHSLSRF